MAFEKRVCQCSHYFLGGVRNFVCEPFQLINCQ
jgi:hypothetical protein